MDGGGGGFPVCEEERTVNEWGTNKRIWTADRRVDGGGGGFPVCEEGQTVNEWGTNKRIWTADRRVDGGGGGFPACEEEQTVNEWGNEYTNEDRRRQTAVGQAFQPVERKYPSCLCDFVV
jgi:hypothetical protein